MAPTPSTAIIESVFTFIKGGSHQPASKPGFAHALKLSYNTISKERISVGPNTLTYRYRFDSPDVPKASVGLFTALMDELSTNACFRVGQPSAPGVTLQFQTEILDKNFQAIQEVDVVNTVTKLGRTVSHTRTDFVCAVSNKPLAFSSHVKYMPTGSRLLDWVFSSKPLYKFYANTLLAKKGKPPLYDEKPLIKDVIRSHLEFQNTARATFQITREHTNPFGAMHGGCHAMLMEQVGEAYARAELSCDNVLLEAMQVDFLGAARGSIEIVCETIGRMDESAIHARVLLKKGGRILSEGKLRFSKV